MKIKLSIGFITLFLLPVVAQAQISTVDLNNYQHVATYLLPPADFSVNPAIINANEASAVTYNWDTNTLFVVGDEGGAIVEVSLTGNELSQMSILGFNDPEGLTYTGNGKFVIVEERNRDVYEIQYAANTFIFKNTADAIDLGSFVDNIGIEGISYDPRDGSFMTVKEKSPQEVNRNTLNFTNHTAIINSLFTPALGVADLADVQVLATVPSLIGTADEDNMLLFSQESAVLLKVDRTGQVLSQFDFSGLASTAEGVTIDTAGNIYIVAENGLAPQLFVLSPNDNTPPIAVQVPMMPWWLLMIFASVITVIVHRRASNRSVPLFGKEGLGEILLDKSPLIPRCTWMY